MPELEDYRRIFSDVESTLIQVGSQWRSDFRDRLYEYKLPRKFTDAEYFRTLVHVVFFSGFKADTVEQKCDAIDNYLTTDYRKVADSGSTLLEAMMADRRVIRNRRKIQACIENARTFASIVGQNGSFERFLSSFDTGASFEEILRLRRDLIGRFAYLGPVTSLHFLMEIGLPVLKPDLAVSRIFCRLRLIDNESQSEDQIWKAVDAGRKFVQATGYPIRYIDFVFAAYGQVKATGDGLQQGICLGENPRCEICGVFDRCGYFESRAVHIDGTDQSHRAIPGDWRRRGTADGPAPEVIEMETLPVRTPKKENS